MSENENKELTENNDIQDKEDTENIKEESGSGETFQEKTDNEAEETGEKENAVDSAQSTAKKKSGAAGYYLSVSLPLLAICAVIAALMALVNGLTIDRINENNAKATREAINRIYPSFDSSDSIADNPELPLTDVFQLNKDGEVLGYCAAVQPKGFNGAIEMMVGVSPEGVITGVEIISHSETPGVGARADDPAYLDGYDGLSGKLSFGDGIDALSGATISSRAILSGVNAAVEAVSDIAGIAVEGADEPAIDANPEMDITESGEEAGQ